MLLKREKVSEDSCDQLQALRYLPMLPIEAIQQLFTRGETGGTWNNCFFPGRGWECCCQPEPDQLCLGCGHSNVQAVNAAHLTGLGENPDVIWTLDGDKRVED